MTQKEKWNESLLSIILVVGGVSLTIFPIIYLLRGQYLFAIVEGICGIAIWISLLYVKIKHRHFWPARIGWIGVQLVLTLVLISGGIEGTGLLWWSLLPIVSYILFGHKRGNVWLAIGLVILIVTTSLGEFHVINTFFTLGEIIQTGAMILVTTLIMNNYERIASQSRIEAEQKAIELEEQIRLNKETNEQLVNNLKLLEKDTERQEKIRSAMMNLLEDSQLLENELKQEKAGVEKKIEERTRELTDTKAKLDSSIENLPLGFLMVDINEKLVMTNSLAKSILGSQNDKENLSTLENILKDKVNLRNYIITCNRNTNSLDVNDIELSGRFFQFMISPVLTSQPEETCLGVVILIQDTTEAKILERSKDEFFSIASHELRTPLTAIRGNTSMIREYFKDSIKDPELQGMIDDIHESSIRLINIVNDYLNVSRLEQRRMVFDISKVDLDSLIPETIKEYKMSGLQKNLELEYIKGDTPLPLVNADKDKVREVIINLVGNSFKFTSEGGVKIHTEVLDNFVKVLVSDTGRGIALKQQSLLFHKFQQTGESLFTRDTTGGSGLGLYISKMMIEGMGGQMKLEKSDVGKGTTFSFSLPISTSENEVNRLKSIGL